MKIKVHDLNDNELIVKTEQINNIYEDSILRMNPVIGQRELEVIYDPGGTTIIELNKGGKKSYLRVKETKTEIEEMYES
jgi:hypothetical protein